MVDAGSVAGLAIVCAGIAVVIAVAALVTAAEFSRRLQEALKERLNDVDVRVSSALEEKDKQLATLRDFMSQIAEDQQTEIRRLQEEQKGNQAFLNAVSGSIERLEATVKKLVHPNDGWPTQKQKKVSNG